MNPEIEKLIDLSIADGQITEKERNVILRKAKELGSDLEEVEITLDSKLHQLKTTQAKPTKEKAGNIITCPACGFGVNSFESICSCGHEFRNIKAVNFLLEIEKRIEQVDKSRIDDFDKKQKKKQIIENIPIPNSKEDLLELLSIATSKGVNVSFGDPIYGAWRSKAREALIKIEIMFPNDKNIIDLAKTSKEKIAKAEKSNSMIWISIALLLIVVIIAGIIKVLISY